MSSHPKTPNEWARFWYATGGIPIPSDGINKKPIIESWKYLQNGVLSKEQFEKWLSEDAYKNGIQVIVGKILNNFAKKGFYLNCIDLDNEAAIKAFLNLFGPGATLEKLATRFIIEQHADKTKAHVFVYSNRPFKRLKYLINDANANTNTPKIEILSDGKDIVVVSNSPHANGSRRELLSDPEKIIYDCISVDADDFEKRIDSILSNYDIAYLLESDITNRKPSGEGFYNFDPNFKIKIGSRHNYLIRYTNSLIRRLYKTTPLDAIKNTVEYANKSYFEEPLPDIEVQQIFEDATKFIGKQVQQEQEQESHSDL